MGIQNNYDSMAIVQTKTTTKENIGTMRLDVPNFIINPSLYDGLYIGLASFGLFGCVVLVYLAFTPDPNQIVFLLLAAVSFGLFGFGLAGRYRLHTQINAFKQLLRHRETAVEEQRNEPNKVHTRYIVEPVRIKGPMGTAEFNQPKPGAFRRLIATVLDNSNKLQLSNRTAQKYDFSVDDYKEIVGELRRVGIVASQLNNSTAALTNEGRIALDCWLNGRNFPPHPSD